MRLTKTQCEKIIQNYGGAKEHAKTEKNKWFEEWKPFAEAEAAVMCRKYPQTRREDHFQAAYLGLWEAASTYDEKKGSFRGWLELFLKKSLYDQARMNTSPLTISRYSYEEGFKNGFTDTDLKAALDSNSPLFPICVDTLDLCIGEDNVGGFVKVRAKPNEAFLERTEDEQRIIKDLVETGLKYLKMHDKTILYDRFKLGMSYKELSEKYGKSVKSLECKVRRILKRMSHEIK